MRAEVRQPVAQLVLAHHKVRVAHHPLAEAVAAVDGALGRDAEGDLVRVVVDEVLDRAVTDFVERIDHAHDVGFDLGELGHELAPDRVPDLDGVHQARGVGRERPLEEASGGLDCRALAIGGRDVALQRLDVADARAHLPAPVGPLGLARVVLGAGGHEPSVWRWASSRCT